MDWVACVGVDWGDSKHTYEIDDGGPERSRGEFGSAPEDVHGWARALRERYPAGIIAVVLEQGRGSLIYALSIYDFLALIPLNPRASKSYRSSLKLSGASSDQTDAALLCEFGVKHRDSLRVWLPEEEQTRKLRLLVETRRDLVDQRTGRQHALAATLKDYFPQALQWFGGEESRLLRMILRSWPTLEQLRGATREQLVAVMKQCRCHKISARVAGLLDQVRGALPLTTDAAIVEPRSMYAQALVELIDPLDAQIRRFDRAIAQAWNDYPDREIFDALPGAGAVLAPRLAVAFGLDRDRYTDAAELQCYSGIAPVKEQSGKSFWIHARWGFPKFLHQSFHEFAQASLPYSRWARAVYDEQRSRGAGHHQAIRALAFRWIRILFCLWQTRQHYDEQRHLDSLVKTHSPIINRLVA